MDHISLHKTSVATYGYLTDIRSEPSGLNTAITRRDSLEAALLIPLYLPRHVTQQALEDIDTGEIVDKPCVLCLALLEQIVLIEDGL